MPFESDIFISYAHVDNESLEESRDGWVAHFQHALEVRIAQLLGKRPKIWRDPKLQGNDIFADTLLQQLPKTALLVSVFSPRYVQSEWCLRELQEFWTTAEQGSGVIIKNKARVFKVVKTPVSLEKHPSVVQSLLGYDFFKVDPVSGRVRELDKVFGADAEQAYWLKLDDLAQDMSDLLTTLETQSPAEGNNATVSKQVSVYVAETSLDLKEEYETIRRDLQRHGYTVLPDRTLPLLKTELELAGRAALRHCRLSVHLLGRNYGIVPEGAEESLVVLQNILAKERGASGNFSRLLWIPRDLHVEDPRQQAFLEQLRTDPELGKGADLLETSIEDLKTCIYQQLALIEKMEKRGGEQLREESELLRIYLLCDQRDQEQVAPVQNYLFDQGFEVTLPAFEGEAQELREDHEENLRTCDAVLIYYGAANDLWLRKQLREIQKSAGYGREQPLRVKAICVALPKTPQKEQLRTREALVLSQLEGFTPESVQPFLTELRKQTESSAHEGK
jgi:hypothetical protein